MTEPVSPLNYHKLYAGVKYGPTEFHALNDSVKKRVQRLAEHCFEMSWYVMSQNIRSFTIYKTKSVFEVYESYENGQRQVDDDGKVVTTNHAFPYGLTWLKRNQP